MTRTASRLWTPRGIAWLGALVIGGMLALAGYDILQGYRMAVLNTERELDAHARVIAEQTARSLQAIEVVMRYLAAQFRRGAFDGLSPRDLRAVLQEQAVGLVQADGLLLVGPDGRIRATTYLPAARDEQVDLSSGELFRLAREGTGERLYIASARSSVTDGQWIFPIGRRLVTAQGEFGGAIAARGRIAYFQDFYRDVRLDEGTTIALVNPDRTLMARHPPIVTALGKPLPLSPAAAAAFDARRAGLTRTASPLDGLDRFVAQQPVPVYGLAVFVTREAGVALAPWRDRSIATGVRTLALATLAALLLWLLARQLVRLDATRRQLENSQDRFSLAVAGSDDGIWEHDFETGRAFNSARARELVGLPPGPEELDLQEWLSWLPGYLHPDDLVPREAAMQAHLAGRTPTYEVDVRHRHEDGEYRWVRVRGVCVRDAQGKPLRIAGSVSDIDARKRAEAALRASEEQYRSIFNAAQDSMVLRDAGFRIVDVNAAYVAMTGVSREEAIGQNRVLSDDSEGLERLLRERHQRVLAGEPVVEVQRIHRAGQRVDLELHLLPVSYGGKPHVLFSGRNITERKRAEENLRESDERFHLAVAGSNDGIVDWDLVNDRMYASERALEIMGIRSDVTVRSRAEWRDMIQYHPDDQARMSRDLQDFLDGRSEMRDGEYRVLHPDGSYRWIRHRNKCVRDAAGRPLRVAGSISDVDAQKRAEERFQLAVDGSHQGLWDWDMHTDLNYISPRLQEIMGLEPGEPLRPRKEWLALTKIHPDDLERVSAAQRAHRRGESTHLAIEYRIGLPSGEWRWVRQRGVALRDGQGKPYRIAGSTEDVTAFKNAEAERARLGGQLLQAKKLEAIGTLAGGIAHDFNNILSAILGYGEMAQKSAPAGTPLRRHLDAVVAAGLRAKSLVERILAFSRSGVGARVAVGVQSVVAEALGLVTASLPEGVRLESALGAPDAAVMGDPTQIHQVVMNLCANAAQAMKAGGTLTVTLDVVDKVETQAATSTLAAGRYVRLAVADTGTGISEDVRERIFDPFFTTKGAGVGTGLGLSLVHGIVTDLGGGIDVESHGGKGTRFTVYLPWSDARVEESSIEEVPPMGAGQTILLVDDEEPLVRLGEELIAGLGYEPVGFTSSAAALAEFRAAPDRFQAVLSDETMPELTGSALAQEIRRLRPDIPIVLMTGFVSPALSARARGLGVAEVLSKPLVARDIARSLAAALRNTH
jgi:PAS domain S-box-containing protein